MAHVRRSGGAICAVYFGPQKSFVTEFLDDANAEVQAFFASLIPPAEEKAEREIVGSKALSALVRRIAKKENKTEREILDEIRAEAKE